ncbi:MAG: transposase [Gammaproteobacteria bacterium]|nr:transposase [Gammaproteobacteria bacterium]
MPWACRQRIARIVKLSKTIRKHRGQIEAALRHRLSNAIV